jgi:alpha-L-fucosidase
MWPAKVNKWNLRDHSSFDKKRDVLAEPKAEADRQGIKFGLCYSIWDWHDPDARSTQNFARYMETFLRAKDPDLIINNRISKRAPGVKERRVVDGDFGTPEQTFPSAPIDGQLWESCMTIPGKWGYAKWDKNFKSATTLT